VNGSLDSGVYAVNLRDFASVRGFILLIRYLGYSIGVNLLGLIP
jgi:hypothetical protein